MKKIIFAIALVLTIVLSASAQSDGFFRGGNDYDGDGGRNTTMPLLPGGGVGARDGDQPGTAPLGSGLIVLTALGAGYALTRKNR